MNYTNNFADMKLYIRIPGLHTMGKRCFEFKKEEEEQEYPRSLKIPVGKSMKVWTYSESEYDGFDVKVKNTSGDTKAFGDCVINEIFDWQ